LAEFKINLLSLTVLAVFSSLPVHAAEPGAGIQTLEWNSNTDDDPASDHASPTEAASPDDVWQRIRYGF